MKKNRPRPRRQKQRKDVQHRQATQEQSKLLFRQHLNRYDELLIVKDYQGALDSADRALAIYPFDWEALTKRAFCLYQVERYAEALDAIDRSITAARLAKVPGHRDLVGATRGDALFLLSRFEEAIAEYNLVTARKPDFAIAHFDTALAHLILGQYVEGWRRYQWRFKKWGGELETRYLTEPRWTGNEPLDGKTVLLRAEQGLGDTIQFIRYAPLLAARGAQVVAEIQPALAELVAGIDGVSAVVTEYGACTDWDFQCATMSLPAAFGTTLETIPAAPYVLPNPERIAKWRDRVPTDGLRIGIVWAGNPGHANDKKRSIELERLAPLLSVPGIRLVSLQQDPRPNDAEFLAQHSDIVHIGPDMEDFADTAAVVSMLDMVISVDTAVAHLTGAMGKPVWILLAHQPDFRWLLDRDDSSWYPTARLFRQQKPGDWAGVIDQIAASLQGELAQAA